MFTQRTTNELRSDITPEEARENQHLPENQDLRFQHWSSLPRPHLHLNEPYMRQRFYDMSASAELTVSLTITPTTNGVIRGIKLPKALLIPISDKSRGFKIHPIVHPLLTPTATVIIAIAHGFWPSSRKPIPTKATADIQKAHETLQGNKALNIAEHKVQTSIVALAPKRLHTGPPGNCVKTNHSIPPRLERHSVLTSFFTIRPTNNGVKIGITLAEVFTIPISQPMLEAAIMPPKNIANTVPHSMPVLARAPKRLRSCTGHHAAR
ncbi:hypothetical protein GQX74_012497 [Glossina fuscipes]|nr:hypothetical protein GQX74_012497 [Glossina fuscipes]